MQRVDGSFRGAEGGPLGSCSNGIMFQLYQMNSCRDLWCSVVPADINASLHMWFCLIHAVGMWQKVDDQQLRNLRSSGVGKAWERIDK